MTTQLIAQKVAHPHQSWSVAVLVILPWLSPLAAGPTPVLHSWLAAAVATTALFAAAPAAVPRSRAWLALPSLLAWIALRGGIDPVWAWTAGSFALFAAAALVAAAAAGEAHRVHWMVAAVVAAACINAAIGLLQYFGASAAFHPFANIAGPGEAFGNLRQRNQFASLMAIGTAGLIALTPARRPAPWGWAGALLLAAGNAASASRTGAAGLALVVVLAALVRSDARRGRVMVGLAAIAGYLLAAFLLPLVLEALQGVGARTMLTRVEAVGACSSRLVLWDNVLQLIARRPWSGWGWGELDFAHYAHAYEGMRFCDILDNAHNLPLHLAVELGIPAMLLVGAVIAVLLRGALRIAAGQTGVFFAWGVLGVVALHSMVEYPLWYGPFQLVSGLAVGLMAGARAAPVRAMPSIARAAIAGICAAALTCVAWDYQRASQIYRAPEERAAAWRDDALAHAQRSWLFADQAAFAELTTTPLSRATAQRQYQQASALIHYSPEPRVVEKLVESATMVGRDDEAVFHLSRYRDVFPAEYRAWSAANAMPRQPASRPQ